MIRCVYTRAGFVFLSLSRFLIDFWLGSTRTSRHESWIAPFSDGRDVSNNMWAMFPSQSHLLRFRSFGAFVWSFGRCPKWRWIFHFGFFFVKCWKWTSSLLDVTGTFVGDTFVDWDHWWIVAMERSWYLKGVGSHWCEIRITEFQSNVTNHDFQELQHAWKASKTQDGGNSLHSAAALCPLVSKSGDKQWTWYYLVLFIYFWKLLMGTICLFFLGLPYDFNINPSKIPLKRIRSLKGTCLHGCFMYWSLTVARSRVWFPCGANGKLCSLLFTTAQGS